MQSNSTPKIDLRKEVLVRNVMDLSPLRKSAQNMSYHDLSVVLERSAADDELERRERRSIAQKRRTINETGNSSAQDDSFRHYDIERVMNYYKHCAKLHSENKINARNVWDIRIVDVAQRITSENDNEDTFKIAANCLEICAKVIGLKVDLIYAEGQQLQKNLMRYLIPQSDADINQLPNCEELDNETDASTVQNRRKKRRKNTRIIVKNVDTLLAPIKKKKEMMFMTKFDMKLSAIGNLFTNIFKTDHSGINFPFMSDDVPSWPSGPDPILAETDKITFPSLKWPNVDNFQMCTKLPNFTLDDDHYLDEETRLQRQQEAELNSIVVYDKDGFPVPEHDGPLDYVLVPEDGVDESDEEEKRTDGNVIYHKERIVSFMPRESNENLYYTEFSYNPMIKLDDGRLIEQVWAGPSHWKVKHVKPAKRYFMVNKSDAPKQTVKRKRKTPKILTKEDLDFELDYKLLNTQCRRVKRKRNDPNKFLLPPRDLTLPDLIKTLPNLTLKPDVVLLPDQEWHTEDPDEEVDDYNYENPNDSNYCAQNNDNEDDGQMVEGCGPESASDQFINGNLVEAPPMVNKEHITFALKAKKMDMSKLKQQVQKELFKDGDCRELQPTNFLNLYQALSHNLSGKMKENLSVGVAFVSLLHVATEKELKLDQIPGTNKDFHIKKS